MGLKPFAAYHGGNLDTVSLSNGNLFVKIPLFSVPQRGAIPMSYSLYYNVHHTKTYKTTCTKQINPQQRTEDSCTTLFVWQPNQVSGAPALLSTAGFQAREDSGFGGGFGPTQTANYVQCHPISSDADKYGYDCITTTTAYRYINFKDTSGASHIGAEVAEGSFRSVDGSNYFYDGTSGTVWNSHGTALIPVSTI